MRTLHVNDYRCGGAIVGGTEVLIETTIRLLRERGCDVDAFTGDDTGGAGYTPLGYIDNRAGRIALTERLNSFRPDIIHLHNFYHRLSPGILSTIAAWRDEEPKRPTRVVMTAHDFHLCWPNSGANWFLGDRPLRADAQRAGDVSYFISRRWDRRGTAHSAMKVLQHLWNYRLHERHKLIDCVICPSRYVQGVIARLGMPTTLLPHPVPSIVRAQHVRNMDTLRLVFVGRVEPEKGLDRLLELLPGDFCGQLLVVGDGSATPRCREIVRRRTLSDRVEFAGRLPHGEALRTMASSHVLVLPSRCPEGNPLALLEALACGTNLLVSAPGGAAEVVADAGVGYIFNAESGEELAERLRQITTAFNSGQLNDFDASRFLRSRSEEQYLARLLSIYNGG